MCTKMVIRKVDTTQKKHEKISSAYAVIKFEITTYALRSVVPKTRKGSAYPLLLGK